MTETDTRTIKVWDPLVRMFHWGLAASFLVAFTSAEEWKDLHEWAGYAAGALISFRLIWGLFGPRYARFRQFVRSPGTAIGYLRSIARGTEKRYIGHNPAGGLMIVGLIVAMGATALTGWMQTTDAYWGVEWVQETHELLGNLILFMVLAHLAGVAIASLRHRENLVRSMITGHKRAPTLGDVS